jgi:hypothetical protein
MYLQVVVGGGGWSSRFINELIMEQSNDKASKK